MKYREGNNMRSEQINELAASLSKAQGKFPILQKRTKAYNYMYADLAEILECVKDVLYENGLSLTSEIDWSIPMLTMTLMHTSGQSISCSIKIIYRASEKVNEMQAMGSSLTYARRYAISCLLNLAADKESDDDGEKSSPKNHHQEQERQEPAHIPLNEGQCAELDMLLSEDHSKDWVIEQVTAKKGIQSIYDISAYYFENDLKKWLINRKKKKQEGK